MGKSGAAMTLIVVALIGVRPAYAETVTLHARQPATYVEASVLRQIVVTPIEGNGGPSLTAALRQQFMTAGPDNRPYFAVVSNARGSGIGILSGDVTLISNQSSFTDQRSRCVESAGFLKCRRSETYTVRCAERTDSAVLNLRIVRASDRAVVYATTKTYPDSHRWCEGSAGPPPIEAEWAQVGAQVAAQVFNDVAPHTTSYRVRLLETTKGLSRAASTAFKAAVLVSPRDMAASCAQWNALAAERAQSPALEFDLGLCAEQAGNLAEAEASFARALLLLPGNKTIAEGSVRVRGLAVAQATAAAQMTQRANAVAVEQRQAAAAATSRRAAEAAAQRQIRQREGAAVRQGRQRAAAAQAVQNERRRSVARQYGAGAADAILSGTVRTGMTKAQARAAVGSGCRVQTLGAGEEQWFCGSKRIVFSGGRVTTVR